MNSTWHRLAEQREAALRVRGAKLKERLNQNMKNLPQLQIGDNIVIQNQLGNQPLRWDRSGTIIKEERIRPIRSDDPWLQTDYTKEPEVPKENKSTER